MPKPLASERTFRTCASLTSQTWCSFVMVRRRNVFSPVCVFPAPALALAPALPCAGDHYVETPDSRDPRQPRTKTLYVAIATCIDGLYPERHGLWCIRRSSLGLTSSLTLRSCLAGLSVIAVAIEDAEVW